MVTRDVDAIRMALRENGQDPHGLLFDIAWRIYLEAGIEEAVAYCRAPFPTVRDSWRQWRCAQQPVR